MSITPSVLSFPVLDEESVPVLALLSDPVSSPLLDVVTPVLDATSLVPVVPVFLLKTHAPKQRPQ